MSSLTLFSGVVGPASGAGSVGETRPDWAAAHVTSERIKIESSKRIYLRIYLISSIVGTEHSVGDHASGYRS